MEEFAFRPAVVRVRAGRPARLLLVNGGQIAHQFGTAYLRAMPVRVAAGRVSAETAGLDAVRLDPEGAARLEFIPRRKGRYVFVCTIEGHEEAGMRGALEVQ